MAFKTVASLDELGEGQRIVVEIGDLYVAIFNVGGNFYAVEDVCTHDGGPLAEGDLHGPADDPSIECPRHGAHFRLKTGKPTFPAVIPVDRFAVQVDGNEVQIDVENPLKLS